MTQVISALQTVGVEKSVSPFTSCWGGLKEKLLLSYPNNLQDHYVYVALEHVFDSSDETLSRESQHCLF